MNKVNINKFRKNIYKDSTGKIFSPPRESIQCAVAGCGAWLLQYADMTASIILNLFIFWKILKPASDMEVDYYWQWHLQELLRLESYLKIK